MPVRSWGSHPAVGRASRNGLQDRGGGGEIADAGRCRMCKDGFPSWASRGQLITRSQFEHQSKVHPWLVLSRWSIYTRPAKEFGSLLYLTNNAPTICQGSNKKRHSCCTQRALNLVGKTGSCTELECRKWWGCKNRGEAEGWWENRKGWFHQTVGIRGGILEEVAPELTPEGPQGQLVGERVTESMWLWGGEEGLIQADGKACASLVKAGVDAWLGKL